MTGSDRYNCTAARRAAATELHRRTECDGYLKKRETEFREDHEEFPSTTWERGDAGLHRRWDSGGYLPN